MSWEIVPPGCYQSNKDVPALSVTKNAVLSWNRALNKAMGVPERVKVLVNKETGQLGIKSAGADSFDSYRVSNDRNSTFNLSIKGALQALGLLNDEGKMAEGAKRRPAEQVADMWVISLDEQIRATKAEAGKAARRRKLEAATTDEQHT